MNRTLELIFENMTGKVVRLTVDSPIEPADPAYVAQVMDEIIASGVFSSMGGKLKSKRGARIVERSMDEVIIF